MNNLIRNLINGSFVRNQQFDNLICKGETVIVYTVETDDFLCKVWNSSNNSGWNKKEVGDKIANLLLKDNECFEGRVDYDMSEIMFEIIEK